MIELIAINFALILAAMLVFCAIAVRIGDVSFIDAVWGGGMALLAATSFVQIGGTGERGL